jgi:hypothetical protein
MSTHLQKLVSEWRDAQKAIDAMTIEQKRHDKGPLDRLIAAHNALIAYADQITDEPEAPVEDTCTWFVRYRQDWIAEVIRIFGFIQREHLEKKFGISTPQATVDFRRYQSERPGAIEYNASTRRYEPRRNDNHADQRSP